MGTFGILLSLVGLMYLAYRGITVLVLAPFMALVATVFDPSAPAVASYTEVFMPALGGYVLKYFPLFLLGSIFGKLMGDSGAAQTIGSWLTYRLGSKQTPLAVVLACALLTYGGVSLFVVVFCIYPIAKPLFREAALPKKYIPACIALGSFTFTMTALPGTPAIQNAIPMPFFGTTAFAAPGIGIIAAVIMFGAGMFWINSRIRKSKQAGADYFTSGVIEEPARTDTIVMKAMPLWVAILPLILVVLFNYLLSKHWIAAWQTDYLDDVKYGSTNLKSVIGIWSIICALTAAVIALIMLQNRYLDSPIKSINEGTMGSLLPIFNTASEVGYGATIASLASFGALKASVLGILPTWPLISEALSINVLAGITGSASGGLSIALKALGSDYIAMAEQADISPELLHRVATLSCGGLDTLPHNGAVITLLAICGLSHKQSYFDIFMVAVVFPILGTAAAVILGALFGSF